MKAGSILVSLILFSLYTSVSADDKQVNPKHGSPKRKHSVAKDENNGKKTANRAPSHETPRPSQNGKTNQTYTGFSKVGLVAAVTRSPVSLHIASVDQGIFHGRQGHIVEIPCRREKAGELLIDPTFRWTKEGNDMVIGGRMETTATGNLKIEAAGLKDSGRYKCVLTGLNSKGEEVNQHFSHKLQIYVVPRISNLYTLKYLVPDCKSDVNEKKASTIKHNICPKQPCVFDVDFQCHKVQNEAEPAVMKHELWVLVSQVPRSDYNSPDCDRACIEADIVQHLAQESAVVETLTANEAKAKDPNCLFEEQATKKDLQHDCPAGYQPETEESLMFCVACPPGSHGTGGTNMCHECAAGSYQDKYGQVQCNKCPKNGTVMEKGARDASDCVKDNKHLLTISVTEEEAEIGGGVIGGVLVVVILLSVVIAFCCRKMKKTYGEKKEETDEEKKDEQTELPADKNNSQQSNQSSDHDYATVDEMAAKRWYDDQMGCYRTNDGFWDAKTNQFCLFEDKSVCNTLSSNNYERVKSLRNLGQQGSGSIPIYENVSGRNPRGSASERKYYNVGRGRRNGSERLYQNVGSTSNHRSRSSSRYTNIKEHGSRDYGLSAAAYNQGTGTSTFGQEHAYRQSSINGSGHYDVIEDFPGSQNHSHHSGSQDKYRRHGASSQSPLSNIYENIEFKNSSGQAYGRRLADALFCDSVHSYAGNESRHNSEYPGPEDKYKRSTQSFQDVMQHTYAPAGDRLQSDIDRNGSGNTGHFSASLDKYGRFQVVAPNLNENIERSATQYNDQSKQTKVLGSPPGGSSYDNALNGRESEGAVFAHPRRSSAHRRHFERNSPYGSTSAKYSKNNSSGLLHRTPHMNDKTSDTSFTTGNRANFNMPPPPTPSSPPPPPPPPPRPPLQNLLTSQFSQPLPPNNHLERPSASSSRDALAVHHSSYSLYPSTPGANFLQTPTGHSGESFSTQHQSPTGKGNPARPESSFFYPNSPFPSPGPPPNFVPPPPPIRPSVPPPPVLPPQPMTAISMNGPSDAALRSAKVDSNFQYPNRQLSIRPPHQNGVLLADIRAQRMSSSSESFLC